MEDTKKEKELKCLDEKDAYQVIFNRINETRPSSAKRMKDHLDSLGICQSNYYLIKNFVEGKDLFSDRNKPLSEDKLIDIMNKLDMKFINTAYWVKM